MGGWVHAHSPRQLCTRSHCGFARVVRFHWRPLFRSSTRRISSRLVDVHLDLATGYWLGSRSGSSVGWGKLATVEHAPTPTPHSQDQGVVCRYNPSTDCVVQLQSCQFPDCVQGFLLRDWMTQPSVSVQLVCAIFSRRPPRWTGDSSTGVCRFASLRAATFLVLTRISRQSEDLWPVAARGQGARDQSVE